MLSALLMTACGKPVDDQTDKEPSVSTKTDGLVLLEKLWAETTPFDVSKTRLDIFDKIQGYADGHTSTAFK